MVMAPLPLRLHHVRRECVSRRPPVFKTITVSATPRSMMKSSTVTAANCPEVPFTSTTLDVVIPVSRSRPNPGALFTSWETTVEAELILRSSSTAFLWSRSLPRPVTHRVRQFRSGTRVKKCSCRNNYDSSSYMTMLCVQCSKRKRTKHQTSWEHAPILCDALTDVHLRPFGFRKE